MKARAKFWLCAFLLSTPLSAVRAQLAGGLSGHEGVVYMGQEEAFSVIRQMGNCFAQRRRQDSERLLATAPNSAQEAAAVRVLRGNGTNCIPRNSRLRLPRDLIRGAVAEAVYRQSYSTPPPAEQNDGGRADAPSSLADFSRCVARRNPREVHNLLVTTRLGTREEQQGVSQIVPLLRLCLPPSDNTQFAAPFVRLALANALFDHARRTPSASASSTRPSAD